MIQKASEKFYCIFYSKSHDFCSESEVSKKMHKCFPITHKQWSEVKGDVPGYGMGGV